MWDYSPPLWKPSITLKADSQHFDLIVIQIQSARVVLVAGG